MLLTFDLPMKMEKRVFRPSTSTKRSQAAGHRVHAKSCHHIFNFHVQFYIRSINCMKILLPTGDGRKVARRGAAPEP